MLANSLFWKITHPITHIDHYVYGTMHVKHETAYTHIDKVLPYIDSSRIYAGEMDLNDPLLHELESYFMLTSHMDLICIYGHRKYHRLRDMILKAYDLDLDRFKKFKPIILSNMVSEKILTAHYDVSLDQYLWSVAASYGKEMTGLESAQDQVRILNAIDMDVQKKALLSTVKNVSKYRKKIYKLSHLYADQNIQQLFKSTKKSLGKLRKPLLYDRNNYMADRIIDITREAPAFITLGAAHLAGKFGVLRLLKKSGYVLKSM